MPSELKVGIIGLGGRGYGTLEWILCDMPGINIVHVCDAYEDRAVAGQECVLKKQGHKPACSTDYRRLIEDDNVEVVVITSSWDNHVPATVAAMRAGKYVGCEVGGAYSIDDCWELIRAYEETGRHCMMLENCCFGRNELMVLNMVKQGLFGKIAACEGGYHHDLRGEIAFGKESRHYRLRNYLNRNCENYPTHELGPIAKVLGINRGNRMLSLSAMSSGAWGVNEYACKDEKVNPELRTTRFAQGDIVKTLIKCAGGELITLTLDTTLPHHYSRGFKVQGTRGCFNEWSKSIFLDEGDDPEHTNEKMENLEKYYEKYDHPIWRKYSEEGIQGGHDGMDWLEYEAFFDAIRRNDQPTIDTYDMAAWMAITPLSEISIARGGAPVDVPDFTRGAWLSRTDCNVGPFSLENEWDKN